MLLVVLFRTEERHPFRSQSTPDSCDEFCLFLEIMAVCQFPGKGKNITAPSDSEVMSYILADVHLKRGRPLLTIWGEIPTFIPALSLRLMSQFRKKIRDGNSSYLFYIIHKRSFLMDDEFQSQPELCREHTERTTPQRTFPDAGKQHDTVRDVSFQLQCYCSTIDKSILCEQP